MKTVIIHGQSHMGSTYHIAHELAEKIGGEITEFFLPRDFGEFCVGCANSENRRLSVILGIKSGISAREIWTGQNGHMMDARSIHRAPFVRKMADRYMMKMGSEDPVCLISS